MKPNHMVRYFLRCATAAAAAAAVACGSSDGSSPSDDKGGSSSGASSGGSGGHASSGGSSGGASSGGASSGGTSSSAGSSGSPGASSGDLGSDASSDAAVVHAVDGGGPDIFGSWITANSAQTIWTELTLNQDGTYALTVLVPTSSVTGDEYAQHGNFKLSGGALTLTPSEATCPTALTPSTFVYAVNGQFLVLVDSSGDATLYGATDATLGAGLTLVVGCSPTSGAAWTPEPTNGSAPSSSNPGQNPSPYGNWLNASPSSTTSTLLTLNEDGTYVFALLVTTSTQTGDEYVQKGTFVLDGQDLILTATEASCPGAIPVTTDNYAVNGADFSTTDSSGNQTDYASSTESTLGSGLTLVVGCSPTSGAPWTPEPIAAVTN